MKLSPAAELAIRGVMVLADLHGQGPVTLATICAKRDLSREYLAKIFGLLARADIITPIRGKHGGYVLSREPDSITILDVIEAVEGPLALNLCQHNPPKCDQVDCPLRCVWGDLQKTIRDKLGSISLKDGLAPPKRRAKKK